MMKTSVSCASLAGLLALAASCGPSPANPPPEPPQPLVIGTSPPPPPINIAPDEKPVHDAPIASGTASTTALAIPARDPRLARPPRARALVVTELTALEQLFAATAKNAPDRPQLMRRLAEDYAELSRGSDGTVSSTAAAKSLSYYELVFNEAPQYPQLDEVCYYLGLAYELAGDNRKARSSYYDLIRRSPNSKLIPFAYFAFGEIFFVEGDSDPSKNQLAEQAYKEVLKYPAPQNAMFPLAKQRLGEVATRLQSGGIRRP